MQAALRLTTTVQPGGKVEVVSSDLKSGDKVEVIILTPTMRQAARRSALDILADAPGHRLFGTADEVDRYIQAERASWD
jgi:hypothetical protein